MSILLGVSAEPEQAVGICRAKLAGDPHWAAVELLSLGFFSRDPVPDQLPELLRESGLAVTVHPIELNLDTTPSEPVIRELDRWVAALDPLWLEQDGATWLWGTAYLAAQIFTPSFSTASAKALGGNAVRLTERWGREFLVENPPIFSRSGDLPFYEFFGQVATHGGAGLTLDIGHAIGAQLNTGEPVRPPSDDWPGWPYVRSIHLSGQTVLTTSRGPVWMDGHGTEFTAQQLRYTEHVLERATNARALTLEMEGASDDVADRNLRHAARLVGALDRVAA